MCFFGYTFTIHRMSELWVFTPPWTDWATKDQPEVGVGSVESIQEGFRGDQWLPDGGKVLCIPFPPPHRLPGGCSAAGAESAGMSGQRGDCINMCLWNLIVLKLIFIFLPRGIILNMVFYTVDLATVLSAVLFLPGFTRGTGETGEQSEEVWSRDPPTAEGVSPVSLRFSQQRPEGRQCKVIFINCNRYTMYLIWKL